MLITERKLCVLGASAVGKTASIVQFMWDTFIQDHYATNKLMCTHQDLHGHLWEITEHSASNSPAIKLKREKAMFEANCCLLLYSVEDPSSLDVIRRMAQEFCASRHTTPAMVFCVTKMDKYEQTEQQVQLINAGCKLANLYNMPHLQISCKDNTHVTKAFESCMRVCNRQLVSSEEDNSSISTLSLQHSNDTQQNNNDHTSSNCCIIL